MPEAQALSEPKAKMEVTPLQNILQKFQGLFQKVVNTVMNRSPRTMDRNARTALRDGLNPELTQHIESDMRPQRPAQGHEATASTVRMKRPARHEEVGSVKEVQETDKGHETISSKYRKLRPKRT